MTPETWYDHARRAIQRSHPFEAEELPTYFEYLASEGERGICDRDCVGFPKDCLRNGCVHHQARDR